MLGSVERFPEEGTGGAWGDIQQHLKFQGSDARSTRGVQ